MGASSLAVYGDGTRVPISGEIQSDPGTDVHMPVYAELAALPTDPAAVRAYLLELAPGDPFHGATLALAGNLVPPALASAIYDVLADEPDVTLDAHVEDAAHRPGLSVGRTDRTGTRHELIFDRDRLSLIGIRDTAEPAGTVVASVAFLDQAVVDEAGVRPS